MAGLLSRDLPGAGPDAYPFRSVPGWRPESGVNTSQSSLPGAQHEFEDMPASLESALEAVISKVKMGLPWRSSG